jgi:hypothetical protein
MTARLRRLALAPLLALALAPCAHAATILVTPALAPNAFGSTYFTAWTANAIAALHDGTTSAGDPSLPSYYQAQSNITPAQSLVTGFPSWMGVADPGTAFGPAFANEYGERMHFGVVIDGDGQQFSISQLSFEAFSDDPANILGSGFFYDVGEFDYNLSYQGVLKGDDGLLWTADDVFVTGGPNTTLVDGLVSRGPGNSIPVYCPGCTVPEQQAAIDAIAKGPFPTKFTGTYGLHIHDETFIETGSGTFTFGAVPEPATWMMMIAGFGLIGAAARRRRGLVTA